MGDFSLLRITIGDFSSSDIIFYTSYLSKSKLYSLFYYIFLCIIIYCGSYYYSSCGYTCDLISNRVFFDIVDIV